MSEGVNDRFKSKQKTLVQLRRHQHLRRRLNEDVVLTKIRVEAFSVRYRPIGSKSYFCGAFSHMTLCRTTPASRVHFLSASTATRRRVSLSTGSAPGVRAGLETAGVKPTA